MKSVPSPPKPQRGRRNSDPWIVAAGLVIVLAVIGLTIFLVVLFGAQAGAIAVLTTFAAVLTAVPPIIKALRGR